ncbi:hypothetical protein Q4519_14845 [Motilimonas sp. 1_MG-2023]|uniref:hypothetical protein n=1 Tax=Motilimonas sp. 1_MG-2023 TaxID=3062672 RepID=UPI0026E47238|nr:hypothetical protein [Motilimonas sp. 1_MG-2023]MDO6526962.1 hypothetical protein [Motilimonas sp. 1_MG-2023]
MKKMIFAVLVSAALTGCSSAGYLAEPMVTSYCGQPEEVRAGLRALIAQKIKPHRIYVECN